MRENFLHYVWKFKKFQLTDLKTTSGLPIVLYRTGLHNQNSGPDFFNAQLRIGEQLWVGNIEIHVRSSDWMLHNHQHDPAYNNTILHVVYQHDSEVFRNDGTQIPTLELQPYLLPNVYENYDRLFNAQSKWINCEDQLGLVDDFTLNHWLERLFIERLERKSVALNALLLRSRNNWEAVLFKLMARSFGLKINSDAFFSIANSIPFSVIRKEQSDPLNLEALFMGQAGFLESDIKEDYYLRLRSKYQYLMKKYQLSATGVIACQFFRLRPMGFPTLRLSQFANLYSREKHLFSKVIALDKKEDFYQLLSVEATSFWDTHFTFSKRSPQRKKKLSRAFIDRILLNTIIPVKFCYARQFGSTSIDPLLDMTHSIDSEINQVIKKFNATRKVSNNALQSQALIELKTNYCDHHKCLSCAIGNSLLGK